MFTNQILLHLGTWNGIKINISSRERAKEIMPWKLVEFIWRRKHKNNEWKGIINCLKESSVTCISNDDENYINRSLLTEVIFENNI